MKETTNKKAILIYDGLDDHIDGCECGQCDQYNRSYGVSVFLATQEELNYTDEEFDKFFACEEIYTTIYACSESSAYSQAEVYCQQAGFEVGLTI